MKKIVLLLLGMLFLACGQSRVSNQECPDFTGVLKSDKAILEDFARLDESSLNYQDACLFKMFVREQQDTISYLYSQIIDGNIYMHRHCPLSQFSFTLISKCDNNKWMYYGLSDVYQMRFFSRDSITSDSMVVKAFNTIRLNELATEVGLLGNVETNNDWKESVTQFILSLYNDKIDNWNRPILKPIESGEVYDFATLFAQTELTEDDFIFFEMENEGVLAFTYSLDKQLIQEYLIYTPGQKRYFKSDTLPSELLRACTDGK